MNLRDFFRDYIARWEGGLSLDPADAGNWTGAKKGVGQLVGSNYGVTPAALAKHRKIAAGSVSQSAMATLTMDEAIDIAVSSYYKAPRFDLLPFNRWIASVIDMGWGAGPSQAIKLLQRQVGVADDGKLGPATAGAVNAYLLQHTEREAAWQFAFIRARFYATITVGTPTNLKFINGWLNRTEYFAPTSEWWGRFGS